MTVEPAGMDDLERLVECWLALAEGQRDHGSRLDPAENADTVRESLAQHVITEGVLVAREEPDDPAGASAGADDDGRIVGFAMFGPDDSGFERDRTWGVVHNVYVEPDARDQGVGTALMDAAEARLAEAGVEEVTLQAMADNEDAQRFYRERGYEPHRVTMAKPLGSDTPTR